MSMQMNQSGMGIDPRIRAVFAILFAAVAAYYLARTMRRGRLGGHAAHLLMAVGMLYMFLPISAQVLPVTVWVAVFGAAVVACTVHVYMRWRRGGGLDVDFAHSELAGCSAMAVMLPLPTIADSATVLPVSALLGTYFLGYAALHGWCLVGRAAPRILGQRTAGEALAQTTMGAGMALMFLTM